MNPRKKRMGSPALLSLVAALAVTAGAFAAPSVREIVNELNATGRDLQGEGCLKHADQYMKLLNDEAIEPADRAYVLQECLYYLRRVLWREGLDLVSPKAREVFALYRGDLVGANPEAERSLVTAYATFLGQEVARDHARLGEALAVIDAHEKAFNADPEDPRADLTRGSLCRAAEDRERAVEFVEKYVAAAADPDGYAYRVLAWAYEGMNQPDKALSVAVASTKRWGSAPNVAVNNARVMTRFYKSGDIDETQVLDALPVFAHDGAATGAILIALADGKLQSGDMDSALAYGKLACAVAPIEDIAPAVETVGRYIATLEMDPGQANRFREYQAYGAAGADGKTGTEDDRRNPLAEVGPPLPDDVVAAIEARLTTMTPRADCVYPPLGRLVPRADSIYALLRDRGCVCLTLGRPRDALRLFRSAWDAATVQWLEEANGLVPRALKALDGNLVRANAYMAFQKFGPAGPDGRTGTGDDLTDRMANENLPPLPPDVLKALETITADEGGDAAAYQLRGFGYLALGEYEKAFDQLRVAYVMVEPGRNRVTIMENIAAAIKAFDGNAVRAKQYLLFQTNGAAGSDKKPGTADDLEDPFPAILRDIKAK